ncbi:hypothetical protein pb186bvf_003866 [Paramecium bursaria]
MGCGAAKDDVLNKIHPQNENLFSQQSRILALNYRKIPNKFKHPKHQQAQGIVGLQNLGNTCYINSAIQCLSNTQPLTDYFLSCLHLQEINYNNPLSSKGQIAKCYANLVTKIWTQNLRIIPDDFISLLSQWNPIFSRNTQEDSHEFIAYLLDIMHEDLNRVKKKPSVEEKTYRNPTINDSNEAWQFYLMRNKSIIVDLFQGQQKNMLECLECGYQSHKFEPFMYLSLPVSEEGVQSLDQIIQEYCQEEILSDQDYWKCPQCNEFRQSKKQISLWKLPNILVVHLKRFKFTINHRCKIRNLVKYPLKDLKLGNQQFDLYSVINHTGTLTKGHYTAVCKNRDNHLWYSFNDSKVTQISEKKIESSDAYLLFYYNSNLDEFERQTLAQQEMKESIYIQKIRQRSINQRYYYWEKEKLKEFKNQIISNFTQKKTSISKTSPSPCYLDIFQSGT